MTVLQRYFTVEITQAVLFVLVAFLGIFGFFDLTNELGVVGRGGYALQHAFLFVIMGFPSRIYELMPLAVLIGTIYVLAQFASRSEFTIMRASSMSTLLAGWMLAKIGLVFVLVAFLFGEVIAPITTPLADKLKRHAQGTAVAQEFRSGLWAKDIMKAGGLSGAVIGSRFFNVKEVLPDGQLANVKLYEFDLDFHMLALISASRASYQGSNVWRLNDVTETRFVNAAGTGSVDRIPGASTEFSKAQHVASVSVTKIKTRNLVSEITPKILSVSLADPKRMSATELSLYSEHLKENKQDAERYQIAFWKKIIDPFAVFVMMALALPFAYLHFRSGGVSLKIFIGIMIGVSFVLLNNLFSHLGLLNTWPGLVTAIVPSVLFMLIAVIALWWVERH